MTAPLWIGAVVALIGSGGAATVLVQWLTGRRKTDAEADHIRIGTAGELVRMLHDDIARREALERELRGEIEQLRAALAETRAKLDETTSALAALQARLM